MPENNGIDAVDGFNSAVFNQVVSENPDLTSSQALATVLAYLQTQGEVALTEVVDPQHRSFTVGHKGGSDSGGPASSVVT